MFETITVIFQIAGHLLFSLICILGVINLIDPNSPHGQRFRVFCKQSWSNIRESWNEMPYEMRFWVQRISINYLGYAFLAACIAYPLNRWLVAPYCENPWAAALFTLHCFPDAVLVIACFTALGDWLVLPLLNMWAKRELCKILSPAH